MPTANRKSIDADISLLRQMAFRHHERCGKALRGLHGLRQEIDTLFFKEDLWNVYDWLLCPLTLWSIDFAGLASHIVRVLSGKLELDADMILLLRTLSRPPSQLTQNQISDYEKIVSNGHYDYLTKQPEKFRETEARNRNDRELRNTWKKLTNRFPVDEHKNSRGVIRRSLSKERNFEPFLPFTWRRKSDRFKITFDALCHRWCLYGFEHDEPLLLKISVNPTPHGTMIVIPRHWSFDGAHDIDWRAVGRIHRAHGMARQGRTFSSVRIEREVLRQQAIKLCALAAEKKLRGKAKAEFILSEMKQDIRRKSWLKRLLKEGR